MVSKILITSFSQTNLIHVPILFKKLQNAIPTTSFRWITLTKAPKQQETFAKIYKHFRTFKSIFKLTAYVANCCKCLQQ